MGDFCDIVIVRAVVYADDVYVEEADEQRNPLEEEREVTVCRTQFPSILLFATLKVRWTVAMVIGDVSLQVLFWHLEDAPTAAWAW